MAITKAISSLISALSRHNSVNVIRRYSVYPSQYVKPVYRKEEQDVLYETEEGKNLAHVPIKPAFSVDTSSEFYDAKVKKFTNYIMRKGQRTLARALIEKTFENVKALQLERYNNSPPEEKEKIILDPKEVFHQAVENCTPVLELTKIRKGGIAYQVPVPVNEQRANFLAMNWLIRTAKEKDRNARFTTVLAKDLIDAANNRGRVVKKKQELHRQCEANRAYAHFRWL